jgi:hypothetical protein
METFTKLFGSLLVFVYHCFGPRRHQWAPERAVADEVVGPMVIRAAPFLPFQATYYLNGHSYME